MTYLIRKAVEGPTIRQWKEHPPTQNRGWANMSMAPQWKPSLMIYEDVLPSIHTLAKIIMKHSGKGEYSVFNQGTKKMVIRRLSIG